MIGTPFYNNILCVHSDGRFWVCLFQIHLGHFLDATNGQQKNPKVFDFDMKTTNTLHWKKSNRYKQKKHDSKKMVHEMIFIFKQIKIKRTIIET